MKLTYLLIPLLLIGCKPQDSDDEAPSTVPTGIRDVWEYSNPDGQCSADERFGDPGSVGLGCLHYAQVTRFHDGAAYFTLSLGPSPTYTYAWSGFLPVGVKSYDEQLHLGSNVIYRMTGDMSAAVPTLTLDLDQTLTFTDGSSRAITLTEVKL